MNAPSTDTRPTGTCCGQRPQGTWQPPAGAPLANACQLCPDSPTYHGHGQRAGDTQQA